MPGNSFPNDGDVLASMPTFFLNDPFWKWARPLRLLRLRRRGQVSRFVIGFSWKPRGGDRRLLSPRTTSAALEADEACEKGCSADTQMSRVSRQARNQEALGSA